MRLYNDNITAGHLSNFKQEMQMENEEMKKKVIVDDDSHTIRLVMKKYLEDKYEVLEASKGEEESK